MHICPYMTVIQFFVAVVRNGNAFDCLCVTHLNKCKLHQIHDVFFEYIEPMSM